MADPSDDKESDDFFQSVLTHDEILVKKQDKIESAFDELFGDKVANGDTIQLMLTAVLSPEVTDSDKVNGILADLFQLVAGFDRETKSKLANQDVSPKLTNMIEELYINHGENILNYLYRRSQGDNWYQHTDTEIVLRGDQIGFTHFLTIGGEERIRITTNLDSQTRLTATFITSMLHAMDSYGEGAANQISEENIDTLRSRYDKLMEGFGYDVKYQKTEESGE